MYSCASLAFALPKRNPVSDIVSPNSVIANPALRPLAPKPTTSDSSTATSSPSASRRCSAADRPVNPPPTTATSTSMSAASGALG
jgi:hypothetical protein